MTIRGKEESILQSLLQGSTHPSTPSSRVVHFGLLLWRIIQNLPLTFTLFKFYNQSYKRDISLQGGERESESLYPTWQYILPTPTLVTVSNPLPTTSYVEFQNQGCRICTAAIKYGVIPQKTRVHKLIWTGDTTLPFLYSNVTPAVKCPTLLSEADKCFIINTKTNIRACCIHTVTGYSILY